MLFLGGNNFDKGMMLRVQRRINSDKDIKKLIKAGKSRKKFFFYLSIFLLFTILKNVFDVMGEVKGL